jgi:hypothetical protein
MVVIPENAKICTGCAAAKELKKRYGYKFPKL